MEGLTVTGVRVTKELAREVLTTAIEAGHTHGFGYWGKATAVRRDKDGNVLSFTVTEHEAYGAGHDQPRARRVTTAEVAPAIVKLLSLPDGWGKRLFDGDGLDGPLAEAIVQVICFDEVIYG